MDDLKSAREWIIFGALVAGWIVVGAVGWQRILDRVNGLGRRVKTIEDKETSATGRMDRMEKELAEYRRDTSELKDRVSRIEKGQDQIHEEIRDSNTSLGVQLQNIQMMIRDQDTRVQLRLQRLEITTQVERKVGPIPE